MKGLLQNGKICELGAIYLEDFISEGNICDLAAIYFEGFTSERQGLWPSAIN